jgi:hypothetical protein
MKVCQKRTQPMGFWDSGAKGIGTPVPLNKFPGHSAWLDWPWILHRLENKKTGDVDGELYDLSADSDESRVLFAKQPERVPQMQEALESVACSMNGEDYQ